jgi:hypothetical protein
MFNKKSLILTAVLASSSLSHAGQIDVVNENKTELKVKIQAEGDKVNFLQSIPADPHSSFKVETAQLNGKSVYSIKGHTSPFMSGDKCKHLIVDKNYTVTFAKSSLGITCIAEENQAPKEPKENQRAG